MKRNHFSWLIAATVAAFYPIAAASAATEGLGAHWAFDEGAGTLVTDSSGNGNDGNLTGGVNWVVEGRIGGALEFNGSSGHVLVPFDPSISLLNQGDFTIMAWFKPVGVPAENKEVLQQGDGGGTGRTWLFVANGGEIRSFLGGATTGSGIIVEGDTWYHAAVVVTENGATDSVQVYVDGQPEGNMGQFGMESSQGSYFIGCHKNLSNFWEGLIDDVALFTRALSQEEIQALMEGVGVTKELAANPDPADAATDVVRNTDLSWSAGEFAATHDVYFGTSFDDVNDASVADPRGALASQGQTEAGYGPGRLAFDQTYYWRVDEVNGAPDRTVFKGTAWSFTVEPFSVPIAHVTATASSTFGLSLPENTINGSGLVDDLHSAVTADMWISTGIPATLEYAFDRVYKMHELWVWNSNQTIEPFIGFGAKDVTIETSVDGQTWAPLAGVSPLAQAPGTDGYAHNSVIDFQGISARYVRMTINSVHGFAPQTSLSEVRFFAIPTSATRPDPSPGAVDRAPDLTLSWGRDGREADHHDVYLGTDPNNLSLAGTVQESRFETLATDLQVGQSYYWQVVEVNDAMDPMEWAGDVWSFTTVGTIAIDDMEGYKDEEFLEIWATWVDGFGDEANNGALVGAAPAVGNFAPETGIVHGGGQSLPIHYDNSAAPRSEATRTFDSAMDWTQHGVAALVLYFQGSSDNTGGQLYVKINDTKIAYDGDASNLMRLGWNKWTLILAEVGANLSRVSSLTVGVDSGGQGVVYVDDIQLTSDVARVFVTPVEPVEGLAVYYPLDGDFQDASGNGRHGTPMAAPIFEAGASGQAVSLNGIDQYVEITGYKGITVVDNVQQPFTVTNWFKTTENGEMVTWGTSPGGQRLSWRIDGGSLRTEHGNGNLRGNTVANDGEWHHGALVVDEGATLRPTMTHLYLDGMEDSTFSGDDDPYNLQPDTDVSIGRRATSGDRYFPGSIDEVRIYDRALSAGEVAWLAGRTEPFEQP
ncbi:MAG: hypothetical protein IH892_09455 [Planctomycetes bacterium]|nr:hypothetical protein [Planctomycetota bacterium]